MPKDVSILYRGRDILEDLKTLKDIGMTPETEAKIIITEMTYFDDTDLYKNTPNDNEEELNQKVDELKIFLGDIDLSNEVIKLALKKCNMSLEEAMLMITDEALANDL